MINRTNTSAPLPTKEEFVAEAKKKFPEAKHTDALNKLAAQKGYKGYNAIKPFLSVSNKENDNEKVPYLTLERGEEKHNVFIREIRDVREISNGLIPYPVWFDDLENNSKIARHMLKQNYENRCPDLGVVFPDHFSEEDAMSALISLPPKTLRLVRYRDIYLYLGKERPGKGKKDTENRKLPLTLSSVIDKMEKDFINGRAKGEPVDYFSMESFRMYSALFSLFAKLGGSDIVRSNEDLDYFRRLIHVEHNFPLLVLALEKIPDARETNELLSLWYGFTSRNTFAKMMGDYLGNGVDPDAVKRKELDMCFVGGNDPIGEMEEYHFEIFQQMRYRESSSYMFFRSLEEGE